MPIPHNISSIFSQSLPLLPALGFSRPPRAKAVFCVLCVRRSRPALAPHFLPVVFHCPPLSAGSTENTLEKGAPMEGKAVSEDHIHFACPQPLHWLPLPDGRKEGPRPFLARRRLQRKCDRRPGTSPRHRRFLLRTRAPPKIDENEAIEEF